MDEYDKCIAENDKLTANLKHIIQLWETEKEFRRTAESERNYYVSI